jgi:hypothetical protein
LFFKSVLFYNSKKYLGLYTLFTTPTAHPAPEFLCGFFGYPFIFAARMFFSYTLNHKDRGMRLSSFSLLNTLFANTNTSVWNLYSMTETQECTLCPIQLRIQMLRACFDLRA